MLASMSIRAIAAIAVFVALPQVSPPGERDVALPNAGGANRVAAQEDGVSLATDAESPRPMASAEDAAGAAAGPPNVFMPARPALGPPASLQSPGVYVWRDPDGLWTVFWRGTPDFATPIVIDAPGEIVVEMAAPEGNDFWYVDATRITLNFGASLPRAILQFRAETPSITCDPCSDRQDDLSHVYIGSRATAMSSRFVNLGAKIIGEPEPIGSQRAKNNGRSHRGLGSSQESEADGHRSGIRVSPNHRNSSSGRGE